MKTTLIKIKSTEEILSLHECMFYSCGTCIHIPHFGTEYEEDPIVYSKEEWESIEVDVFVKSITYARELEIEDLISQVNAKLRNFIPVENFKSMSASQTIKIAQYINYKLEFGKIPDKEFKQIPPSQLIHTKGWDVLEEICDKYKKQVFEDNIQNDFELEEYGLKTEDIIENYKCLKDTITQSEEERKRLLKEFGLDEKELDLVQ